jgi:hypothetical protein
MGREGAIRVIRVEGSVEGAGSYRCSQPGLKVSLREQCMVGRG